LSNADGGHDPLDAVPADADTKWSGTQLR
jgi:hypothetical protein